MKALYTYALLLISATAMLQCRQKTVDVLIKCPSDGLAVPATTIRNLDFSISNISVINQFDSRMSFNLSGVYDPVTKTYLDLAGSDQGNQTIWLEEDGILRGTTVKKLVDNKGATPIDLVFVVDNSGSMGEEADSVASQMSKFAQFLIAQKLNVRFGVVGQDGFVNGALNLTDETSMTNYLNRAKNTSRTNGYAGIDKDTLSGFASGYRPGGENSIAGIYFANDRFRWRTGAQRIYICFTDEPTQSDGARKFDNTTFKNTWKPEQGTIHTVYSTNYWSNPEVADTVAMKSSWSSRYQRPWEISVYTGGSYKFIHSDCRDLSLIDLPVTQALSQTYIVEFCSTNTNAEHDLKLTIKTRDGRSDGVKQFLKLKYIQK